MTTRQEHLDWCKTRALEYVERNDLINAIASMGSDMKKHDETQDLVAAMAPMFLFEAMNGTPESVRRFIEGFR